MSDSAEMFAEKEKTVQWCSRGTSKNLLQNQNDTKIFHGNILFSLYCSIYSTYTYAFQKETNHFILQIELVFAI